MIAEHLPLSTLLNGTLWYEITYYIFLVIIPITVIFAWLIFLLLKQQRVVIIARKCTYLLLFTMTFAYLGSAYPDLYVKNLTLHDTMYTIGYNETAFFSIKPDDTIAQVKLQIGDPFSVTEHNNLLYFNYSAPKGKYVTYQRRQVVFNNEGKVSELIGRFCVADSR